MTIDTLVFTGHRDKITDTETLIRINNAYPGCTWWHGGADGFDTQINRFCLKNGIDVQYVLPDYEKYTPNIAPLRRNDELLLKIKRAGNGILFACYDGRQKGGTFYTINHARIASPPIQVVLVPVVVIEPQNRHYYVSNKTNNNRTRPHNATR